MFVPKRHISCRVSFEQNLVSVESMGDRAAEESELLCERLMLRMSLLPVMREDSTTLVTGILDHTLHYCHKWHIVWTLEICWDNCRSSSAIAALTPEQIKSVSLHAGIPFTSIYLLEWILEQRQAITCHSPWKILLWWAYPAPVDPACPFGCITASLWGIFT